MKIASLMMVLMLGAVLFAEDPQSGSKPAAEAKAKETSQTDASAAAKDAKAEGAKKDGDQEGDEGAAEEKPLHQHPTLLKMLARNNQLRQSRGLRPHRISPSLTKAAQDHAAYMAKTRVFSHYANGGPGGRAVRHGFGSGVLENIGYGYGNVENMFTTWTNSGGHWANMMSNTSDAGFGYAQSPDGTPYWVAVYGTAPKGKEPESDSKIEGDKEVKQASAETPAEKADPSTKSTDKVKKDPAVTPASPK